MPTTTLDGNTSASALDGSEESSFIQGGTDKTYTMNQVKDFINKVTVVSGTSQAMLPNFRYQTTNSALTTLSLPTSIDVGQRLEVSGKGSGGWNITQGAGQQIVSGAFSTTLGATGHLQSTNQYDDVVLECITTNTIFKVVSIVGNPDAL